jgi:capsular exopolysaccharide synthesis family protein
MSEYIINEQEEDELQSGSSLSLRAILELTWALRYWIILSIFICLCCAAVYLYVKPKTYHSAALVMVTTDKNAGMGSSAQMSFIADMTGMQSYNSLTNEKIIIKSTPVLQAVVGELGLNVRYFVRNHMVNRETMPQEVRMAFTGADSLNLNDLPTFRIDYDVVDTTSLKVSVRRLFGGGGEDIYDGKVVKFGEELPLKDWGTVKFRFWDEARSRYQGGSYDYFMSGAHYIMLYSPQTRARELARQIGVEVMEDQSSRMSTSSILQLVMRDIHPERSEKVLAKVIEKYNELTKTYYMTSNAKTMEFIDNRLQDLSGELSEVEGNIQRFSTKNSMVDLESQAKLSLTTDATAQQQLQEVDVQLALLEMIAHELKGNSPYTVLPSNVGLSDPSIVNFIASYNTACIERARLLAGSSENSPVVQRISKQIADLRAVIEKSVANQETSLTLQRKELARQQGRSKGYLSSVPGQKINLAQIERERSVIEPLYVLLQKKREETMLTIVAEPDIARVVEYPDNNTVLVGPNARQVILVALVIGFLLPLLIVYLLMLMKTKVQNPDDIASRTRVPLLGVVPRREGATFKAADMAEKGSSGSSSVLSEAMRTIRTNIGFMSGKVLQFTSSIPGEGKSFVSANVAISLCSIGKKVILVETDLRKGRQHRIFDLQRNRAAGLSNYLSGELDDWQEAVVEVEQFPGLSLLLKGGVPPNPNELLSSDRFGTLITALRENYDYIILDSPPYLVIADPMTLNKYVDRNIYVVRSGKSDLRFINEIDAAAKSEKLNNVSIILNDVQMSSSKAKYGYSYGYNYGYGYGYRYGYGYGYDTDESKQKPGLRARLRSLFSKKK